MEQLLPGTNEILSVYVIAVVITCICGVVYAWWN